MVEVEVGDDNGVNGIGIDAALTHFAEKVAGGSARIGNGGRAKTGVDEDPPALGLDEEAGAVNAAVDLAIVVHLAFEWLKGVDGLVGEEIAGVDGHEAIGYGEDVDVSDLDLLDVHEASELAILEV